MSLWIQLLITYGIPDAYKIYQVVKSWTDGKEPTPEDWKSLLALVGKKIEDYENLKP